MKLSTAEDAEDTEVKSRSETGLFLRVHRVLRGGAFIYSVIPYSRSFVISVL